ncbi:hypothetical protein L2E82_44210 [Cichorium intybus]|uniref:Uncharacterized protein n=1 Tax=Cichorium intybus TaxID=13427 RepID=A0ACB8ZQ89_CICIN|nr:hypothetical protein L2E82_44210 [Cichorium intybus]
MKGATVAILALIAMALVMVHPAQAITCGDLAGMLRPCVGYLQGGGSPSSDCCAGARRVQGATQSQADRRTACNCAKSAAAQFRFRQDAASSLPGKCGISTSIPINPSVNCNT